jgi:hypothetical protein
MIEGSNQRFGQTALIMPRTYSSTRLATALRAASLKAGYTPLRLRSLGFTTSLPMAVFSSAASTNALASPITVIVN